MKKFLQLIRLLILALMLNSVFVVTTSAQNAIPNGNFETWITGTYDMPMYYPISSNPGCFFSNQAGFSSVKVTPGYHGSYAIQLTTTTSAKGDTNSGFFVNIDPGKGNPTSWTGGMAYNQMPTGIRGYYKNNEIGGDTGYIILAFSRSGTNIGSYFFPLAGVHSSYTLFDFTLSPPLSITPDSVAFGATSSNVISNMQSVGSTVTLDSVSFTGVLSQPAHMNGDFELWQTQNLMRPASWFYDGDQDGDGMVRTTDVHSGSYAVELISYVRVSDNNGPQLNPGRIGTGWYPNNCQGSCMEQGGFPYTKQTDTLAFWYKYTPSGIDTASVFVNFKKNGSQVGGNNIYLLTSSSYLYVELPFSIGTTPDTVMVDIQSSAFNDTSLSRAGSDLKIDDIHFKSQGLTGVIDPNNFHNMVIYPNPVTASATFEVDPRMNLEGVELRIIDVFGRIVKSMAVHESKTTLERGDFSSGMYFYEVRNGSEILNTGKLIVE